VLEQALVEESVHQKFDDFSEGAGTAALQRLSPLAYLDLMRDLARLPEPQVRRRAVATLGKMSGSAAAAVVRQALHDPALVVRMEAAAILGERGDKHVLSIYQRDLKLANHDDRYVILQSVKRIQHKWAVDPLRQFAGHGDPFIEVAACEALCKLGDEKAYIALRKAMKSDNKYVRSSAYAAVKDIGGQRAAPLLRKALRDADPAIRMYAAVYLARMNNAGGLHVLRHVLQTDVNPTVRYMVMDAAAQLLDKRVLPVLRLGLTDSSADVRLAAADALLQRGDAQGLTVLRNSLAEGDVPVRLKAVAAARRFRGDGAIDVLGAALVDRSRHVRLAAVDALSERVNVRHHELLANTLRDGDAAVRVAAAVLMVRLDDPAGAAALQKFVAPDAVERAEVLKALESQQAPQFVSYLGTLAENGEEVARVRATVALGKQQNAAAAERLQRLALSTAPMAVRQAAVEALTAMPAEVSTGALHGLLGETLPSGVRYAAAATLGERGDTTAVPVLRQAVAAHDLRAARALCKMGDVGGVELYRQSLKAVDLGERIEAAVVLYRLDRQMGME
jgi:HEAT repeat protein